MTQIGSFFFFLLIHWLCLKGYCLLIPAGGRRSAARFWISHHRGWYSCNFGNLDSPPITQGRKHDITYNGAAGRLRGSWVTIAMMESYPLELAEVRVYGSKWTLAYWYMLTMRIQEGTGPSLFSATFSRDITRKVGSSKSRISSSHRFQFVGELQPQACTECIPAARNVLNLQPSPVSARENDGP